jgi:HD-like signal output (HDOD) protein
VLLKKQNRDTTLGPFFGIATSVVDIKHAICLLGINRLRPIFLSAGVFSGVQVKAELAQFYSETLARCLRTSSLACQIMRLERPGNSKLANETLLAGIVMDAGQLILASEFPVEYLDIVDDARKCGVPLWDMESRQYGVSHSDVGAYLLGIWGFSDPVVEAVAYHHEPSRCVHGAFSPLTAVHIASYLVEEALNGMEGSAPLDWSYLESIDCHNRIDAWRDLAFSKTKGAIA